MGKKLLSILGATFIVGAMVSSPVSAETRGTCTPQLSFTASSVTAGIFEMPLPPNTSKSLDGSYLTKDIHGSQKTKYYSGSIARGQLQVKTYADPNYASVSSKFNYYLNGNPSGHKSGVY